MKELIAFCGLDCESCEARQATIDNDDDLKKLRGLGLFRTPL